MDILGLRGKNTHKFHNHPGCLIVPTALCTVQSLQCTVYIVQFTVYSIQCTVYSVQGTVYTFLGFFKNPGVWWKDNKKVSQAPQSYVFSNMQRVPLYSIPCIVYSVQGTVNIFSNEFYNFCISLVWVKRQKKIA